MNWMILTLLCCLSFQPFIEGAAQIGTYELAMPTANKTPELKWVYETRPLHPAQEAKPHYALTISTIFQNETEFLIEWIEYHKLLGAQHFILYNHFSEDDYIRVLSPYIASGEVQLIEWPVIAYPHAQLTAYSDAIKRAKGETDWLAFIDIDEFIVPTEGDSLITFLAKYDQYAGIVINWQLFGTSMLPAINKNQLMIEALTYKFPDKFHSNWNSNRFVKSIIKPDRVDDNCWSSHCFTPLKGFEMVDPDFRTHTPHTTNPNIPIDKIRINHYWFRTLDWFYNVKMGRRQDVGDIYTPEIIQSLLKIGHTKQDLTIYRFVEKLKANVASQTRERR